MTPQDVLHGQRTVRTGFHKACLAGAGLLLPFYWLLAHRSRPPGLGLHLESARVGLRLLGRSPQLAYHFMFFPLDTIRYFELDFVLGALADFPVKSYLDVSSPRLLFTLLLRRHKELSAELINPDGRDLKETEEVLAGTGLLRRCRLHAWTIADVPFTPGSFQAITSVSVVEHIPEDRAAIQKIWELLEPGGRFLLTVPCAARAAERYIDLDEYGLLKTQPGRPVFYYRMYDEDSLRRRIFSVTGEPRRCRIFGERIAGTLVRNADRKRADAYYPFWREPYMVGKEFTYFDSVQDLPGEGAIAMEFVKP